jgi:basic membrane protein A
MRRLLTLFAVAAVGLAAVACGGAGSSNTSGCGKVYRVGLVTDVGKVTDKSFNQYSWQGVLDAVKSNRCIQQNYIETQRTTDYETNMDRFGSQGYDMVIAVGALLATPASDFARKNPKIAVVTVDGNPPAATNITRLLFQEDQAGFLVGALAGLMTRSGVVGGVFGPNTVPAVVRYAEGYAQGFKHTHPDGQPAKIVYQPFDPNTAFNDPDWGKARAIDEINQGADVIFGGGGNTGNGALLGALQKNVPCIGVDVDQYLSYPDVDRCLLTSAEKHLEVAVKGAVLDGARGSLKGELRTFNMANDGVGMAPYHVWDSKVPADVKSKMQAVQKGLADGSITTGVNIPF